MISFIQGILYEVAPSAIVVDHGGLGYRIFVGANTFSALPQVGEKVLVHTSMVIRENSHALYGFLSSKERDLFELLMNVNGIGPKLALCLIGHLTLSDLQQAIVNGDAKAISRVPGVGKKTAERIIIEMRDKALSSLPTKPSELAVDLPSDPESQTEKDILGALVNLGYTHAKAKLAVDKTLAAHEDRSNLSVLITEALRHCK